MSIAVLIWGPPAWLSLGVLLGCAFCYFWMRFQQQKWQQDKTSLLRQAADEARNLLSSASEQAERKAEETESKARRSIELLEQELERRNNRLDQRESLVNDQLAGFVQQEKMLHSQQQTLQESQQALARQQEELNLLCNRRQEELENISQLTEPEARRILLQEAEQASMKEAHEADRRIMEKAKLEAEAKARKIISLAIQRFLENTHSILPPPRLP